MPAPVDAHRDGVRQQYIPYRTLRRPRSRHRDDRSVAEIVISEVGIDRPETLHGRHSGRRGEGQQRVIHEHSVPHSKRQFPAR